MMKAFLFLLFAVSLMCTSCFRPGGGGSDQLVPDSIESGKPSSLKLELSVWGSGGSIKGRYTDLLLHYRCVGQEEYQTAPPQLASSTTNTEVYVFTIPAFPAGTKGSLEFYFDVKLNGVPNHIPGMKKVPIF